MIILSVIYWVIALFCLKGAKKEENKWVVALAFFAGLAGFGRDLEEVFVPYLVQHFNTGENIVYVGKIIHIITHIPNIVYNPYFFLMFTLAASNRINIKKRLLLLIPPVIATIDMVAKGLYPFPKDNYILLNIYVIPYVVYGFYILIKLIYEARKQQAKRLASDYAFMLVGTSPMAFQLFSVYIARLFKLEEAFRFNIAFLILITPFLIYISYSNGLFNTRLKVEVTSREETIRAMSNSTEILIHALKNRILVMELSTLNIENDMKDKNLPIPYEIDALKSNARYILKIVERMRSQTRDFNISKEEVSVFSILNNVDTVFQDMCKKNNIEIYIADFKPITLNCDRLHIEETLCNIIKNAIEAINQNGKISIDVLKGKKYLTISIADAGCGISRYYEEKIFQPFFTTKDFKQNFGLGLTYCYQVMQKHQGKIRFDNNKPKGTVFYLDFPLKHVKELSNEEKPNEGVKCRKK